MKGIFGWKEEKGMKAYKYPLNIEGSCNFCNKGKLKENGEIGLDYPYDYIYYISGRGVSINLCEDCYQDLKNNLEVEDFTLKK